MKGGKCPVFPHFWAVLVTGAVKEYFLLLPLWYKGFWVFVCFGFFLLGGWVGGGEFLAFLRNIDDWPQSRLRIFNGVC